MSTLQDLQALVTINIGGRDDADAVTIVQAAINYAYTIAGLIFEPPELKTNGNLTVSGGSGSVSYSTLTSLLDILIIYNTTDAKTMWFIPYELWFTIVPSSIGSTKYYSLFGQTIYVKDAPSTDKVLAIYYSKYPTKLVNSTDSLAFDQHDSYIVGVASAIAMAALEESESAQMWQQVVDAITTPLLLGARARQVIAGQKLTLESAIAQVKGAQE